MTLPSPFHGLDSSIPGRKRTRTIYEAPIDGWVHTPSWKERSQRTANFQNHDSNPPTRPNRRDPIGLPSANNKRTSSNNSKENNSRCALPNFKRQLLLPCSKNDLSIHFVVFRWQLRSIAHLSGPCFVAPNPDVRLLKYWY